jgi:predicted RNA-binding protein YlqC (UPF0109 family)
VSDVEPGNEADVEPGNEAAADDTADELEYEQGDANRVTGATAQAVLTYIAKQIVDDPEAVVVEVDEGRSRIELRLHVAPDDMGKIIGKRGRVAQAVRTVVRAAGAREGVDANVDIVD